MTGPYAQGLERNAANYTPLTPVSFLAKAADVYPDRARRRPRRRAPHLGARPTRAAAGSPRRSRSAA